MEVDTCLKVDPDPRSGNLPFFTATYLPTNFQPKYCKTNWGAKKNYFTKFEPSIITDHPKKDLVLIDKTFIKS